MDGLGKYNHTYKCLTHVTNKWRDMVSHSVAELPGSLTHGRCQHLYAAGAGLKVTRV